MLKLKREFSHRVVAFTIGIGLASSTLPAARGADSDLNFKLYSPGSNGAAATPAPETNLDSATVTDKSNLQSQSDVVNDAPGPMSSEDIDTNSAPKTPALKQELPKTDTATTPTPSPAATTSTTTSTTTTSTAKPDSSDDTAQLHGLSKDTTAGDTADKSTGTETPKEAATDKDAAAPKEAATDKDAAAPKEAATDKDAAAPKEASTPAATTETSDNGAQTTDSASTGKVLQGYARVVPSGTKFPIVMDTAVDSDTSQEGDEFSARTSEDLSIDGQTVVPAGSIIKGRIAALNAPRRLNRTGSVALKFDTITTPDNRQIPLVANLVARGGVVHARRGLKDIAIDATEFTLPSVAGLGIGLIAGTKSSSIGAGGGAVIGAGVGVVVGMAILLAKKGKKVDVRPGDELKVELAEDLRMPTL
jgi:type IV secretory pathway VirB10-like protein